MSGITATFEEVLWPIVDLDNVNDTFFISGDKVDLILGDEVDLDGGAVQITVAGSTGNDGTYTVSSLGYYPPDRDETQINVQESVSDSTVDGAIPWNYRFSVTGDRTSEFSVYRRIRANCGSDGYKYSYVLSAAYNSAENKTIINLGSPVLTSNLIEVHYGRISVGESGALPVKGVQENLPRDLAGLDHGGQNARGSKALNLQTGRPASHRVAYGDYSVAIGYGPFALGKGAVAIGWSDNGSPHAEKYAVTVGKNAKADYYCVSIGKDVKAYQESVSIGKGAEAFNYSAAVGPGADSGGSYSVAVGYNASADNQGAVAVGGKTTAGYNGVAVGHNVESGWGGVSIGYGLAYSSTQPDDAPGAEAVAIGYNIYAGAESVAIGDGPKAGAVAVAIGYNAQAKAETVAIGNMSYASYDGFAGGSHAHAKAGSTAVGAYTTTEYSSVSVGYSAEAKNSAAAMGYKAYAGNGAVAVGYQAHASQLGLAVGYKAKGAASYAAIISGGICTRKTANSSGKHPMLDFAAAETTVMSGVVDLTAAGDTEISLPTGAGFFPNEVGVLITEQAAVDWAITAVDTSNDWLAVSGDQSAAVDTGDEFTVSGSTGNDGTYTVSSLTYDSENDQTEIHVSESVDDSTADGSISYFRQPSVSFGEGSADPATLSASAQTTGLDSAGARERRQALDKDAGVSTLSATVDTAATADTLSGRVYFQGLFVEDE